MGNSIDMFGLFKAPLFHIRKRVPQHMLLELEAIATFAATRLDDLPKMEREYAQAFIASVWACNAAVAGRFQLAHKDYVFVQRSGVTAAGWLSRRTRDRSKAIVDELKEKEIIQSVDVSDH